METQSAIDPPRQSGAGLKRYLKAWAMRYLDLALASSVQTLRERNEELEDQNSLLNARILELEVWYAEARHRIELCRELHWKDALASALHDNLKINS